LRLDTECDVVIDAARPANADERDTIAGIRNSLLAEHLDNDCETIAALIAQTGSIIETVERLRGPGRSLRPYEVPELDSVREWLADNKILDPEGPGEMFEGLSTRTPLVKRIHLRREDGTRSRLASALGLGGAIAGAALLGAIAVKGRRK
jgi:hypothetical protein